MEARGMEARGMEARRMEAREAHAADDMTAAAAVQTAPEPLIRQLFICIFACMVRAHFGDLVPEGTRLSTGGQRRHRKGGGGNNSGGSRTEGTGRAFSGPAFGEASRPIQFATFAASALCQAGLPLDRMDATAMATFASRLVEDDFDRAARRMAAFAALRATLAPLVESVILIDQMLFLHADAGCTAVQAVPVFEPTRSPRNLAIVALKREAGGR